MSGVLLLSGCLAHAQDVIVGGDYDYPPHSYITADSTTTGYDIAVLEELEEFSDLSFSYRLSAWDSALAYLKQGEVDILTGIIYSEEREAQFDFTVPIHTEYYAIFTRKEFDINGLEDLTGRRAALLKGDISVEKLIKPMGLLKNADYVNSLPEAITSVEYSKADYVIAPYSLGKRTIEEHHYTHVVVKGPRLLPSLYCLAVKKGNISLLARLNNGISELKQSGRLEKIEDEWFRFSRKRERLKRVLGLVGIIAGLVIMTLILLYAWFRSLKRQVKIKTSQILQTERKYRDLFNFNKDGLILFDLNGTIVNANPEACRMYGYSHEEMINLEGRKLVAEEYRSLFDQYLAIACQGKEFNTESLEMRKDGTTFHSSVRGVKIEYGSRLFVVVRDISREKKAEKELIRARKKAESAYEYKSNFLSHVSHEIRTPLNAIIGYSRLLNKSNLDERHKKFSDKLMSSAEFLVSFINDTLDLSKLEAEKVELEYIPFSLDANIRYVSNILSVLARQKELDWEVTVDAHVHDEVLGDPFRMRQILLNLGSNAIKYTRKGKVEIHLTQLETYDDENRKRGLYRVEVTDTGPGITEEQMEKIFQPFNQASTSTTRKFGGTGLGLSICRDLLNLMGSKIQLTSKPGKGSVFSFNITLTIQDETHEHNQEKDHHSLPEGSNDLVREVRDWKNHNDTLHHAKILVADDSDFNIDILVELLNAVTCQVHVVRNGREALYKLQQESFDAVLMDVQMPDMNGNETTRRIRNISGLEDLPVIGLSARTTKEDRDFSFQSGMSEYLTKPVLPEKLFDTLTRMIKKNKGSKPEKASESLTNISSSALANYNDNWTTYHGVLSSFILHFKNVPDDLIAMYEAENISNIRLLVHKLVNAFGAIGASDLQKRSMRMEQLFRENKTLDRKGFEQFIASFRALIKEIEDRYLN